MEVQTPGQAFAAFLGALGFTRPVEQLELRSVPLPSLLSWLSRPNCCNLVEATTQAEEVKTTSACRSMAIAVSEEMLYKDRCPLVGVGLVYTPPYLPRVPFSVAFMNLCVWRDAQVASENWLVGTRLMFIHASEASEFLPVAEGHPVLLDASTTEVLGDIETSVSPLLLRGFQLHTVLVPLAEGGNTRNIVSPRFQGGNSSALILYDKETVPPELGPQPPMRISLCAPSQDHWTIVLDTVYPSTIEEYRQLREQTASKPTKAGALPSGSPGSGAGRTKVAPSRERALQMARSILDQAHALQIQSMGDLGRIRDLDRTLAGTLMAEFSRVQLIVQEDVGKSLVALRSDLLAACSAFLADVGRIMDVPNADPRLALLEASLERFRRQASLKFDLPLAEMAAAAVDIRNFMNARLQELSSLSKLPDLIGEAATLMDQHHNRVWELVQNPDLGLSDVYSRVLVGLLARQPIEADLFPGILEGLAGNLGLSPAGTVDPPRSRQEGVMRRWATALRQAAYDPSDTGQGSASSTTPLGLHLDYSMEFRSRRVGDIPPALTSSLLPSFPFLEKPKTGEPPSPPAAQQPEETDSPQSHYLTKRVRWISNLTNKRCWCNSPSRRGRRPVCGGLLARNPQAGLASLLTRRTIVSSLYPTTGQIPMVLVPPLGGRYPPRARNGVGRADHPMHHLRRNQQTKTRLHPNRIRARLPKQQRPFSLQQGMSYTARTIRLSKRYGPAFSGWTLT